MTDFVENCFFTNLYLKKKIFQIEHNIKTAQNQKTGEFKKKMVNLKDHEFVLHHVEKVGK